MLLQSGPDTALNTIRLEWRQFSGYSACDTHVVGFSHTHMVGAGVADYGNLGVMPVTNLSDDTVTCVNISPKVGPLFAHSYCCGCTYLRWIVLRARVFLKFLDTIVMNYSICYLFDA